MAQPFRGDQGTARSWIARAVAPAHDVDHQVGPVVELDGEPVPARLRLLEEAGPELVIHPAQPLDVESLASDHEPAGGSQPGERVVVGRVAELGPLLTETVHAVQHRRRGRLQAQVDGDTAVVTCRHELVNPLVALVDGRRPSVVPDVEGLGARPRPADAPPIQTLGDVVRAALDVGYREVRHVQVAHRPARRVDRLPVDAEAKERELVAEPAAGRRAQVAGVVPPFDAVVRMRRMVARKDQRIARIGGLPGAPIIAVAAPLLAHHRHARRDQCAGHGRRPREAPATAPPSSVSPHVDNPVMPAPLRGSAAIPASPRHPPARTWRPDGPDRGRRAPPRPRWPRSPGTGSRPAGETGLSSRSSAR